MKDYSTSLAVDASVNAGFEVRFDVLPFLFPCFLLPPFRFPHPLSSLPLPTPLYSSALLLLPYCSCTFSAYPTGFWS
jgi:hypothetical protein